MKILIDNNISYRITGFLNNKFISSSHVVDFGLDENTSDSTIWKFAATEEFTILTKDNDFEAMSRLYGCPPKVIQLNCGNQATSVLKEIILKNLEVIQVFISDNENCLMYLQ